MQYAIQYSPTSLRCVGSELQVPWWGGGQYGTEPIWYRPIMVQTRYLAMLNYIFGTTMKSSVKWC